MRPVRLEISGYTCFKDQTILDLKSLDLFVISGATGSGKSSVLDAMIFALFGQVPRAGKHGLAELISIGRDRMAVVLEFQVGDQTYCVMRGRRHTGAAQAQLERWENGGFVPVAENVREVDRWIQEILGIDYDAFKQAVVLPQGEFARFLKCVPAERRRMLNNLFRLEVFESMRKKAAEQESRLDQATAEVARRLQDDYNGATPEAVANLTGQHTTLAAQVDSARQRAADLQNVFSMLERDHEKCRELTEKETNLDTLHKQSAEIKTLMDQVAAAHRASGVVPLLDQADRARQAHDTQTLALQTAEAELQTLVTDLTAARDAHALARTAAEAVPGLRDRQLQLTEVLGKVEKVADLDRLIDKEEGKRNAAAANLQALGAEIGKVEENRQTLDRQLTTARTTVVTISYDPELDGLLETVRDRATQLKTERVALHKIVEDAVARTSAAAQAQITAAEAEQLRQTAEQARDSAANEHNRARTALLVGQNAHAAAHLRGTLTAGQPCPVCRQAVAQLPEDEPTPLLKKLEDQERKAEKALQKASVHLQSEAATAAATGAQSAALRQQADDAEAVVERRRTAIATLETEVADAVSLSLPSTDDEAIEVRVLAAVAQTAKKRRDHADAVQVVQELEKQAELLTRDRATLVQQRDDAAKQRTQVEESLAQLMVDIGIIREEIRAVTSSDDPRMERDQVGKQIDQVLHELDQTSRRETSVNNQEAGVSGQVQQLRTVVAETHKEAAGAAQLAQDALRGANFATPDAARRAQLTPAKIRDHQAVIEKHGHAVRGLQARVAELVADLGERRVAADEVTAARIQAEQAVRQSTTLQKECAVATEQLRVLEEKVQRAQELRAELETSSQQHIVYQRLADDLQSHRFQAYRLVETLTALVRGAAAQLARLTSDRYGLDFVDDAIVVIDHDNAGERRSTDTLSGGETFLTSLALALELSDQVQRAVGAVRLDCLFIDEGFGTLDPEALQVVADAVRNLQVGGRMVGIITHVPELKEQFEQRIVVAKEAGQSTVCIEGNAAPTRLVDTSAA